jgi:dodecin
MGNVYKKVEIVGTSSESLEDAIQSAVTKAAATLENLRWFEVVETRGVIDGDRVSEWQVTAKIGFTVK